METFDKTKGWGKIFIGTRYMPQNPMQFTESLAALSKFGMRAAPDELVKYVEELESLIEFSPKTPRPDKYLAQGDRRDYEYSKTMHKAANSLTRKFLETDCDTLCFIDSDAVFGSEALEEIRMDKEGYQFDVLQAFTVKRGFPPQPMYIQKRAAQPQGPTRSGGISFMTGLPIDPDFIYDDVGAVSLHFTLIRRWVFEKMLVPEGARYTYWFEYSRDNGEDITFSANASAVGAKFGMSTRLKVGHVSEIITGWDTMVDYYYYKYLLDSQTVPPANLQVLLPSYQATMSLAELVAEYTGETRETVFKKAMEGNLLVADRWQVEQPQTPAEVERFYGVAREYLYDLVKWNSSVPFGRLLAPLQKVSGERIFEIGGGIGTVTEMLASQKNQIVYYDVEGELLDFARWRFARWPKEMRDRVTLVSDTFGEPESFDRVIALDVLEHIHPANFRSACDLLFTLLKPGGTFYAHNTFKYDADTYPQHFDSSAEWDKFISASGLIETASCTWVKPTKE